MKLFRLRDLHDVREGHILQGLVTGKYLNKGGLGFKGPGFRTHTNDGPGGIDRHVHPETPEVFMILQGKAVMEIDGARYPLAAGDICVAEPGEDHHLISDEDDPCVNIWLETGEHRHPAQESPVP
jgi:mannose-6-phosphate isomerase-like protein (cupin superfamily)